MERLIVDQVVTYLETNNLINSHQSGYRKNFSTQTVLLNLTDTIRRGVELGLITTLLMFDLSKAFDTIDHSILLRRLYDLGFTHHTLQWFHDYLLFRQQAVMDENGNPTEFITISSGVPQGSVLGPILFLIYMNSIIDCVNFAIQNCLLTTCKSIYRVKFLFMKLHWLICRVMSMLS